jgi:DNA-binding transcriptional MerR regulator
MSSSTYRIGTLARLSGVTTHALRIWERRYAALTPKRTPGGARLYSAADLERVRLLKQLTDAHHSIGSIAQLPLSQLRALARRAKPSEVPGFEAVADSTEFTAALLESAAKFDIERSSRILRQASARLSPRDLVLSVVAPVLEHVGRRWQQKHLCIASEHAISALLRSHLGQLLALVPGEAGPPVVCATPSGELHELGALIVAVLISVHGQRTLYLGANLPADEIAEAVRVSGALGVALSIVSLAPELAQAEVHALAKVLPRSVDLLLGGRGVLQLESIPKRATVLGNLAELDTWLETRARSRMERRP